MNERPTAARPAGDEGFTLVEVLVAILVFGIVSSGVVAAMTTIIQMTADNRARITAANLASQELDTVRAVSDPYSLQSVPSRDIDVDTRTYHLVRTVSWISSGGSDVSCNSSTNLFYQRVNVRVSWEGMLGTTSQVQDDTILAPDAGSTDSATGAIGISVIDSAGDPVPGVAVSVTITPGQAGEALASQPKATTADGCTYANDVKPGTYRIKISKTGFVDPSQVAAPYADVAVTAGDTASRTFTFAQAGTLTTTYAAGPVSAAAGAKPTNLPTNFTNSGTVFTTAAPASSVALYPFSNGYAVTAGPAKSNSTTCASVDPQSWLAGTVNGVALRAGSTPTQAAASGSTAPVTIPMGVVRVRASLAAALTATQATATGDGNPGCGITGSTLTYSQAGTGGWVDLMLPYGSWKVLANGAALAAADEQVLTNVALPGVSADGTVTLDPRKAR